MLELFKRQQTEEKGCSNDFNLSLYNDHPPHEPKPPIQKETVHMKVYVLSDGNNKTLPVEEEFHRVAAIRNKENEGFHVELDIEYLEWFKIGCKSTKPGMISKWQNVLNIFRDAPEDEIDNIVLIGLVYAPIMNSRRIFLEEVRKAVGNDIDRYERIRKRLEFYAPGFDHQTFYKWFLV